LHADTKRPETFCQTASPYLARLKSLSQRVGSLNTWFVFVVVIQKHSCTCTANNSAEVAATLFSPARTRNSRDQVQAATEIPIKIDDRANANNGGTLSRVRHWQNRTRGRRVSCQIDVFKTVLSCTGVSSCNATFSSWASLVTCFLHKAYPEYKSSKASAAAGASRLDSHDKQSSHKTLIAGHEQFTSKPQKIS